MGIKKMWVALTAAVVLLTAALVLGCVFYQGHLEQKPVVAVKKEVAAKPKEQLIPEETFNAISVRFKRRDVALDLEQAHKDTYSKMKEAVQHSHGDDLDGVLYAIALTYLDQLSITTAREVLAEAKQPETEKNIRELVFFSNNTEKARMIVLFEMEYLKSDGLVMKTD